MSGGKGNSRAQTSSASTTNVTETTTTSIDNRVYSLDPGAIEAGRDIAINALGTFDSVSAEALGVSRDVFRDAADLAGRGADNALAATGNALSFGETALASNERTTREALAANERATSGALAFGGDAIQEIATFGGRAIGEVRSIGDTAIDAVGAAQKGVLDFAADIFSTAIGAQSDLTGQNISGLTGLARQTSESADDRVTRVVGYLALALVAVFVLPAIFGGKVKLA